MAIGIREIVVVAVGLLIIAIVLPLGLGYVAIAGEYNVSWSGVWNETATTLADVVDPAIITLITILIPILAVIGIAVSFVQAARA